MFACMLLVLVSALTSWADVARAHEGNVGFSEIWVRDATVEYALYLDAEHLSTQIPVGADGDLVIWEAPDGNALKVTRDEIAAMVRDGVTVTSGGRQAQSTLTEVALTDVGALTHLGGVAVMDPIRLLEVRFAYEFATPVEDYRIDYDLFFPDEDQEPHSNLAWIHADDQTATYIFSPEAARLTPERAQPAAHQPGGSDPGASAWPHLAVALIAGAVLIGVVGHPLLRRHPRNKVP